MSWKFLNIGKANAEIERLEKALLDSQAETAAAKAEAKSARDALAANDSDLFKNAEKVQADFTAATARISQLETAATTSAKQITDLTKERDELKATIANPNGAIATAAAVKASEITAGQGQPVPIKAAPVTQPGTAAATMKRADFAALNPGEQAKHIRAGGKVVD